MADQDVEFVSDDEVKDVEAPMPVTAHQAAVNSKQHVEGAKDTLPAVDPSKVKGELKQVHFVEDGFTAFGTVWYRGQEVSIDTADPRYQETVDREGNSWMDLDEDDQILRYDRVMFRPGPWRGVSMEDAQLAWEQVMAIEDPQERKAMEKKLIRQRKMPMPGAGSKR